MDLTGIGFRQIDVIRILSSYPKGATVNDVLEKHAGCLHIPTYSSLYQILCSLVNRGVVTRSTGNSKAGVYTLTCRYEDVVDNIVRKFVVDAFDGEYSTLLASLERYHRTQAADKTGCFCFIPC